MMHTGILLMNLGTPDEPTAPSVRRYLREFLSDPRVIDISPLGRQLLLNLIILPFRPSKSAAAYRSVWYDNGSPLLVHSEALRSELERALAPMPVALGMRYGSPSLADGLDSLRNNGVDRVVVLPLYPQYSAAATGSSIAKIQELAATPWDPIETVIVPPFPDHPAFVDAQAALVREQLDQFEPDRILFSYHGLPERQIRKSDPSGSHCLSSASCCEAPVAANRRCYRAHCYATTRALVRSLELDPDQCLTAFQSRLGRTPWIQPFTDEVLVELARDGVKRLLVAVPSFTADCLETLEEIGIRAVELFTEHGGEELRLVPCVNASPLWVSGLAEMLRPYRDDPDTLGSGAAASA